MTRRLVLAAGLAAGLAIAPASASATIFRIGSNFRGSIHGSLTITWARASANGNTGQSCRDWISVSGSESTTLRSATIEVVDYPSLSFLGAATPAFSTTSRTHVINAMSTEANCPGVCPGPAAASAFRAGPRAHAADCLPPDRRLDRRERCDTSSGTADVRLKGTGRIDAIATVNPQFRGSAYRCAAPPAFDPPAVHLFDRSDLRHIGRRGKFLAQNTARGRCRGVKPESGYTLSCRFKLSVKLTMRRTR